MQGGDRGGLPIPIGHPCIERVQCQLAKFLPLPEEDIQALVVFSPEKAIVLVVHFFLRATLNVAKVWEVLG